MNTLVPSTPSRRVLVSAATRRVLVRSGGPQGAAGLGFNLRGPWVVGTAYAVNDVVQEAGSSYACTVAHTSGSGTRPASGGSWSTVWMLLIAGASEGGVADGDAEGGIW